MRNNFHPTHRIRKRERTRDCILFTRQTNTTSTEWKIVEKLRRGWLTAVWVRVKVSCVLFALLAASNVTRIGKVHFVRPSNAVSWKFVYIFTRCRGKQVVMWIFPGRERILASLNLWFSSKREMRVSEWMNIFSAATQQLDKDALDI